MRPFPARAARIAAGAASAVLAAIVVRLAIGAGQVNYDSLYALVWGRSLAHGDAPDYGAGIVPPTPHPLSTLIGALLAPFGAGADTALRGVAFLVLGAIAVLAFAVGRRWLGTACGLVAAVRDLLAVCLRRGRRTEARRRYDALWRRSMRELGHEPGFLLEDLADEVGGADAAGPATTPSADRRG